MRLTAIAEALTQVGWRRPAVVLRGTLASHRVRKLYELACAAGDIAGVNR